MLDIPAAERTLARADPVMRRLIAELGPCTWRRARGIVPYQVLVRAVAHQQLHGVAAEKILGRPDVLPADDFGLRSGFRAAYRRRELPTPRELRTFSERWRPNRSVASWYLWQAANRARK